MTGDADAEQQYRMNKALHDSVVISFLHHSYSLFLLLIQFDFLILLATMSRLEKVL